MAIRVGINGFGRIGRQVLRAAKQQGVADLDFVAVNDLTDTKTLAHLFKYDSVHRTYQGDVSAGDGSITVDGDEIKVLAEKDPAKLPWKDLGVDIVLESTGRFTDADERAEAHRRRREEGDHLRAGEGRGHHHRHGRQRRRSTTRRSTHIISNASCTTNCLVPMVKVIRDNFGFVRGSMVTIHSYTNDQNILDLPHKDLRRARAAALSMIPTTTGAAKATSLVIPGAQGQDRRHRRSASRRRTSRSPISPSSSRSRSRSSRSTRRSRRPPTGRLKGILAVHRGGARLVATTSATRTRASSTRRARTSSTALLREGVRLVRQRVGLRVALRRSAALRRRASRKADA